MAIGHVWTTHVAAVAQARDRSAARVHFQHSKHTAKGQLVDLLLARGMLKIDAMSLADTLEGYPDLFVAALAGESLVGGDSPTPSPAKRPVAAHANVDELAVEDDPFDPPGPGFTAAASSSSPARYAHYQAAFRQPPPPPPPPPHAVLSYGRLSDFDMDPDAYGISMATRESRLESVCMMVSFTLFAVLPALVLNEAWSWSNGGGTGGGRHQPRSLTGSSTSGGGGTDTSYSGMNSFGSSGVTTTHPSESVQPPFISPLSLALTFGACLMWCLGVWKSRFLDRTYWIWFGIETVVVFGLCILTAFGLGALLRSLLLQDSVYVITTSSERTRTDDFW
jgi:hypothetical protein